MPTDPMDLRTAEQTLRGMKRTDRQAIALQVQLWRRVTPDLRARTGSELELWHALDQLAAECPERT